MMRISVILPVLNESACIGAVLAALAPMRADGHEVIVVDGGSSDGTPELAGILADRVLHCGRGRARQMNAGAAQAGGDVLWFVHADCLPPPHAARAIAEALVRPNRHWGRFSVRLTGGAWLLRVVERMMNARSCLTGIATGDQGMFVERPLFQRVGGFPEIALMEDIALSRALKRNGRPACLAGPMVCSSRRWQRDGIVRTIMLMWWLRLAFAFGADPARLARRYYGTDGASS